MGKFEMDFKKSFSGRSNVSSDDVISYRPGTSCSKGGQHYPQDKSVNPLDSPIGFANTYPLNSDLSGGQRSPAFEQPGPGLNTGVENNIFWSEATPTKNSQSTPGFI